MKEWGRAPIMFLLGACPFLWNCGAGDVGPARRNGSLSPDAKLDTYTLMREDLEAERHPADGNGKAWLVDPPPRNGSVRVQAGSRHRFDIAYEAGPAGVVEGGAVYLQTSPFWDWDSPQIEFPEAPGYTEVRTDAAGVELQPRALGAQLLAIEIAGRKLEEGERIHIAFGAGLAKARVDRYAEHRSRLWIAVDGDGDGVRALISESPSVDVIASHPARLLLTLPTTARTGESVRLTVALVDAAGNAGFPFTGEVAFQTRPEGLDLPKRLVFETEHRGHQTLDLAVRQDGVYRLKASAADKDEDRVFFAESNPLVVHDGVPRILWGDFHGHSQFSDGTGTPEDYFRYARDVASLDVAALTDHDHWGMRFLDQTPEMWAEILDAARNFNEPERFVALAGYEWTSWLHGHRHVLYFADEGEVFSSMDPRYETPKQLWDALANHAAISVAHHSAGGPVSTNWRFVPDTSIEPITEIVSVHGSSESSDSPKLIYDPVSGNFVRDALSRGLMFGLVGSGDSHDGHPGLAHLASPGGGLAAIVSEEVTRDGVLDAFRARRVYATNGPRIWLRMWLDDHPMGSILDAKKGNQRLKFAIAATAPIDRIDLIRSGQVVASIPGDRRRESSGDYEVPALTPGDYIYARVVQEDGGTAWATPIYVK